MRVAVERKRRPTEEMRSGRVSHLRRSAAPRIGSFLSRAEKWMRCSRHTLLDVLWPSTPTWGRRGKKFEGMGVELYPQLPYSCGQEEALARQIVLCVHRECQEGQPEALGMGM